MKQYYYYYYGSSSLPDKKGEQSYDLHYLQDKHDIDANTLLKTQQCFLKIFDEVSKSTGTGNTLNIRINAPKPGSFIFPYEFDFIVPTGLFIAENSKYIPTIIKVFKDVVGLYKLLKGKKIPDNAKKVEADNSVTINITINGNNNVFDSGAVKIYQNNITANKALVQATKALTEDKDIDGFKIMNKNKEVLRLDRKDFTYLLQPNDHIKNAETTEEVIEANLFVKKLDVSPNKKVKFSFYQNGELIQATISDKKFLQKLIEGEKFGNGDSLLVELLVKKKFNDEIGTHIISHRDIQKVKKIYKAGGNKQGNLFE